MANPKQEQTMRKLAGVADYYFTECYGERMGFFIMAAPFFNPDGISDYIGNMDRESTIKVLRKLADRLEADEVIPASQGEA